MTTQSALVRNFLVVESRAEEHDHTISALGDSFYVYDENGATVCGTTSIEGLACYFDALDNVKRKSK
jgi:hypothetical protein